MKIWSWIEVILLAALATGAWALDEPQRAPVDSDIPNVLYEIGEPDRPIFYRLEALQRPDGSIDIDKLSYTVRSELESPKKPTAECIPILPPLLDFITSYRSSLEEALTTSDWVFVAEVRATAKGFYGTRGMTAGTLLKVLPSEILKGTSSYGPEYISMPVAEFRLGGQSFCASDPEYAPLPAVGDRVLLLVNAHRDNPGTILRTGAYTGIITLPDEGNVGLPKRYRKSNPSLVRLAPKTFLAWVRRTLAEGGPQ